MKQTLSYFRGIAGQRWPATRRRANLAVVLTLDHLKATPIMIFAVFAHFELIIQSLKQVCRRERR